MAEHEICEIMIRSVYKGDDGGHREPRSKQSVSAEPKVLWPETIHQPVDNPSSTTHSIGALRQLNRASYFHFRASLQCRLFFHGTRSGLSLLTSRSKAFN